MSDDGDASDAGDGAAPHALDILAGLASLGIAPALREQVQTALAELSRAAGVAAEAQLPVAETASGTPTRAGVWPPSTGSQRSGTPNSKLEEMEQKMAMSRSIMRKLYHKNVELEKELAILRANNPGVALVPPSTPDAQGQSRPGTSLRPATASLTAGEGGPAAQALQERDLTIRQLQQALEAARRRCGLLEMQLASSSGGAGSGAGAPVAGRGSSAPGPSGASGKGVNQDSLTDLLAQSALHHQKYRQIRDDYNRLLHKRAGALHTGPRSAAASARALVDNMQRRLEAEVQEREAEAALYSARLYESEKAASDWYVEKRLLEEHIARLSSEIAERDKLDAEIEGCVTSLLERLRVVEAENAALRSADEGRGTSASACRAVDKPGAANVQGGAPAGAEEVRAALQRAGESRGTQRPGEHGGADVLVVR